MWCQFSSKGFLRSSWGLYHENELQSVCVLFFNAGLESKNTHSAIITLQDLNQTSGSDINITYIILI